MSDHRLGAILAFIAVWRQDRMAACLFVPSAAWVALASALKGRSLASHFDMPPR
jgi:tryptophan-rich sensory protein